MRDMTSMSQAATLSLTEHSYIVSQFSSTSDIGPLSSLAQGYNNVDFAKR